MMSTYETPSYEMMVVAFEDEYKADEVLSTLKQLDVEATVDLKSAAVVKRDAEGKVKIKETKDFDAKQGAIGGAVAGRLAGPADRQAARWARSWARPVAPSPARGSTWASTTST